MYFPIRRLQQVENKSYHLTFIKCHTLPCVLRTHVFGPKFQEKKNRSLYALIQFFLYLYLETKPIIVFQVIILHTGIIIAF